MRTPPWAVELDGVGREVDENLVQGAAAADERLRDAGIDPEAEVEPARLRLEVQHAAEMGQLLVQVERLLVEAEPAGLDLGDVEHVVDKRQEAVRGAPGGRRHVALLGVEPGRAQKLGHADDGVQRCPELVAHGGEEAALRPARLLGLGHGTLELAEQKGEIARQDDEREDEADIERREALPGRGGEHDADEQRGAGDRRDREVEPAIAEAVAEDRPEEEGKEEHRRFAAGIDRPVDADGVRRDAAEAACRARPRPEQQVDEKSERRRDGEAVDDGAVADDPGRVVAERHAHDVDEHERRDDDADQDLLVLAVLPAGQAAAQPARRGLELIQEDHRSRHPRLSDAAEASPSSAPPSSGGRRRRRQSVDERQE
jgi:hypothetical protein